MSNKRQLEGSFSMPNRKRNKCIEHLNKERSLNETFDLFDEDVLDYDLYIAEMYDRENLV